MLVVSAFQSAIMIIFSYTRENIPLRQNDEDIPNDNRGSNSSNSSGMGNWKYISLEWGQYERVGTFVRGKESRSHFQNSTIQMNLLLISSSLFNSQSNLRRLVFLLSPCGEQSVKTHRNRMHTHTLIRFDLIIRYGILYTHFATSPLFFIHARERIFTLISLFMYCFARVCVCG